MKCEYCGKTQPKDWKEDECRYCGAVIEQKESFVFIGTMYGVDIFVRERDKFKGYQALEMASYTPSAPMYNGLCST